MNIKVVTKPICVDIILGRKWIRFQAIAFFIPVSQSLLNEARVATISTGGLNVLPSAVASNVAVRRGKVSLVPLDYPTI